MEGLAFALLEMLLAFRTLACPQSCTCEGSIVKCSGYDLTSIPFGIPVTTKELDISSASLHEVYFPEKLPQMQKLRVTSCKLTKFNSSVANVPRNISELDLSSNNIAMVDLSSGLENIRRISLDFNNLDSFDAYKFRLPNLSDLSLMYNSLHSMDFSKGLESVRTLVLARNAIKRLDSRSFKMPNLEFLNAGGNSLEYLNLSRGCRELKYLQLNSVGITNFDGHFDNLPNLQVLDLRGNNLAALHLSPNLLNIETLHLSRNLLTTVDLSSFTQLKTINLGYNMLSDTKFLHGLANVQFLGLNNNSFASFDVSDVDLLHLKSLNVQNNHLTVFRLPKKILGIESLVLSGNMLREFDLSYMESPRIQNLDLSYNRLTFLDFSYISGLRSIRLASNQLTTVFFTKSATQELRSLLLTGNPLDCGCCMVQLQQSLQSSAGQCSQPPELARTSLENIASLLNCSNSWDCANTVTSTSSPGSLSTDPDVTKLPATEGVATLEATDNPTETTGESSSEFAGIPTYLFILIVVLGVSFLGVIITTGLVLKKRSAHKDRKKAEKERAGSNHYDDVISVNIASDNLAYEYKADIFGCETPPELNESHGGSTFNQGYEFPADYATFRVQRAGTRPKANAEVESEGNAAYIAARNSSYMDLHSKL